MDSLFEIQGIRKQYMRFDFEKLDGKRQIIQKIKSSLVADIYQEIGKHALVHYISSKVKVLQVPENESISKFGIKYLNENFQSKKYEPFIVVFQNDITTILLAQLDTLYKRAQPKYPVYYSGITYQKNGNFFDTSESVSFSSIDGKYDFEDVKCSDLENCILLRWIKGISPMNMGFVDFWVSKQLEVGGGGPAKVFTISISILHESLREMLGIKLTESCNWTIDTKKFTHAKRKRFANTIMNTNKRVKLLSL